MYALETLAGLLRRSAPHVAAGLALCALAVPATAQGLGIKLAVDGLTRPVYATSPPGDTERVFVVELQTGHIRIVKRQPAGGWALEPTPFLDISPKVSTAWQQGFFSVAFHPDYDTNGYFYVYYMDLNEDSVLERYSVSAADPDRADPASGSVVMVVLQLDDIHNGGMAAFGPDGYLYWALGDGGPQFDPSCVAQDPGSPLGKMLRLDVDSGAPYAIPPSNPFAGVPGVLDEIWALGLRNPWRFSWDAATGELFVADVGQITREEVNVEPAGFAGGANYGWSIEEGSTCHATTNCPPGAYPPCGDAGYTRPVHDYAHGLRCSITGGFVYRGTRVPQLFGRYLFADWCSGEIQSFRHMNGQALDLQDHTAEFGGGTTIARPVSFVEDGSGELMIIDHYQGELFQIVSTVGTAYCTAGTSASGCAAQLAGCGVPSASAPSGFELVTGDVEGAKDGLYFFGANGRQAGPWGNGTSYQCVAPPVARAGLLAGTGTSGLCDGSFVQDLNALWCPACPKAHKNPGAGAVVQAQLWYRDPKSTSNQTTSLSNAIEFQVAP